MQVTMELLSNDRSAYVWVFMIKVEVHYMNRKKYDRIMLITLLFSLRLSKKKYIPSPFYHTISPPHRAEPGYFWLPGIIRT